METARLLGLLPLREGMMKELIQSIQEGKQYEDIYNLVKKHIIDENLIILVLDDDPTGCQTVYDVPIVLDETMLENLFTSDERVVFLLTNSRSLSETDTLNKYRDIKNKAIELADRQDKKLVILTRSDSTLRGHFQAELSAVKEKEDKVIFVPAFFEGGRFTFQDIHYVQEGEQFVPAAQTPFADDASFGYQSANLTDYIYEKTGVSESKIKGISIEEIRNQPISLLVKKFTEGAASYFFVNATAYIDLQKVALASLFSGQSFVYRSAASFVNAIAGIPPRGVLSPDELGMVAWLPGLVVIGSYVPKTTTQLNKLKSLQNLRFIELPAENLRNQAGINALSERAQKALKKGHSTVLYTSREPLTGESKEASIKLINQVAEGLVEVVKNIKAPLKYMVAKGGITSNDMASKVLQLKQTRVRGQIIPGVPVWKSEHYPFIVFPGNVGDENALYELILKLES